MHSPPELRCVPPICERSRSSSTRESMIARCETDGFRPRIVQDTQQWPTAVRLIAAGLGVSIAPACVASLATPNVVYKRLRSTHRTSVDIGIRRDFQSPVAEAFLRIIRQQFSVEN
ncbi:LysR substrate-binding domain-containing protein [Tunturiibacter gelidiferens]|uniref:LysR substrate-binding domain-containing protein n=1 Tax=Tunturiibacter gelidiferens TaxID=3069689 RepID=UPI003D9B4FC6